MKFISIFMSLFTLIGCQTDKETERKDLVKYFAEKNKSLVYEVELIDGLAFPKWLKGVWQNTAESNTNNIITYSFVGDKLTMRQGLHFQGSEKFTEAYKDFQVSERSTDSTYLIELMKDKRNVEYEFKLQKFDWTTEKVLTYSIIEDGELKRDHLTSIQLVLSKIKNE